MTANYDDSGNYLYPDGFDPETQTWLPGYETAQAEWERQYAEAQQRFEAHKVQVEEARKADQAAALEAGEAPSSYSSTPESTDETGGALASDEALAALREKLTGAGE
jgi:small subunit ribosomal protein S1